MHVAFAGALIANTGSDARMPHFSIPYIKIVVKFEWSFLFNKCLFPMR